MKSIKKTFAFGRHQVTLETGEIARQADGAVLVTMDDTVVLVTCVGRKDVKPGQDFFPLTVDYQEKTYAAGTHPRRLLQARRPSVREGDPHLPPDRPAAAPALPGRLLQRSPGHRDGAVDQPGDRFRHPGDDRRLGGGDALRHSVRRPHRRGARGLPRRRVRPQPDQDRARDLEAEPRRRRHRTGRADGRVGSERAVRGSDAGRRGVRPRADAGRHQRDQRARRRRRQGRLGLGSACARTRRWSKRSARSPRTI